MAPGAGVGYIDLPIHREKVTHWPLIPGSAFKGVWRNWAESSKKSKAEINLAFGQASDRNSSASNSGALVPTDARIVCLPVRSFQGTFAWCTSPLALSMLHRDLHLAGMNLRVTPPPSLSEDCVHHTENTVLSLDGKIYFEDLDFNANNCATTNGWGHKLAEWVFGEDRPMRQTFIERFVIVPDDVFTFLTETGTEVTTRVKIDDTTKTVVDGQLWSEEALPSETILSGLIACDRVYSKSAEITPQGLLAGFATQPLTLQIGGKATVGRGRVRCTFTHLED